MEINENRRLLQENTTKRPKKVLEFRIKTRAIITESGREKKRVRARVTGKRKLNNKTFKRESYKCGNERKSEKM